LYHLIVKFYFILFYFSFYHLFIYSFIDLFNLFTFNFLGFEESTKKRKWLNETTHEIKGDTVFGVSNGAKKARQILKNPQKTLFEGLEFFFFGIFSKPSKEELIKLVSEGGGKVTEKKPKLLPTARSKKKKPKIDPIQPIVIYDSPQSSNEFILKFDNAREGSWLLNCISAFEIK